MKNIIFDFGNVLITFDQEKIISQFTSEEKEKEFIRKEIINSPEWVGYGLIDSGYITEDDAINLINDRSNNKYKDLVYQFLKNYNKYMYIQQEIIDKIKDLKNKGYKIYMLSNTNHYMYEKYIKDIEYLFDGIVLSYKIHAVKPNNYIYEYIIKKYNLTPEETLFIDDNEKNIFKANEFGIQGRKVKQDSIEDIMQILKEYRIGE